VLDYRTIKYFKQAVNADSYKETNLDIACRCPICGDSKSKKSSKRLHLYRKGDVELVNCFNQGCACENKTMYSFLRDFYPDLLPMYRKEVFTDKINVLKSQSLGDMVQNHPEPEVVILKTEEIIPDLIDLSSFLKPLTEEYIQYLTKRGLAKHIDKTWSIGTDNIQIGGTIYNIKDYLVIPLMCNGKMYGFYSRSIHEKDFITYISTLGFKVWNWFGINKDQPCYIFEAIFDGLSTGLNNIIANLGAKLHDDRIKDLKDPIFCLDNDKTGIETSIKYAQQGYKVFIMPNKYHEKDFNELKLNNPDLDISELVRSNIYSGVSAITRLKMKI